MNLAIIVLSLYTSQLLYGISLKQVGLLFERYAVFIAGYWLAEYVEKNIRLPILVVIILIISIWFRRFLPSFLQNVAINVSYCVTGFGLCCLLTFCLQRMALLSKILKIIGSVTLEYYMLNVSSNWILIRMNLLKDDLFTVVYWFFSGVVSFIIALLIHKFISYVIKRSKNQ